MHPPPSLSPFRPLDHTHLVKTPMPEDAVPYYTLDTDGGTGWGGGGSARGTWSPVAALSMYVEVVEVCQLLRRVVDGRWDAGEINE